MTLKLFFSVVSYHIVHVYKLQKKMLFCCLQLSLIFVLLLPVCLLCQEPSPSSIEKMIQKSMNSWQVPGCSVAIVKNGKIILAQGFGKKRSSKDYSESRVDEDTLFPIASLTKPFTATAVGVMIEQNQLDWNDPVVKYFSDFNLVNPYAKEHLTLRDCLSMYSGLSFPSTETLNVYYAALSQDDLIKKLEKLPFSHGFRGCFSYQNLLYLLVSKAIESRLQSSWNMIIKEKILDPLQMTHTHTSYIALLQSHNKAHPHQWQEDSIKEVAYENLDNIASGAGISSCASDMAKWLLMLNGHGKIDDLMLIKETTLHEIIKPHAVASIEGFLGQENAWMEQVLFPGCHFLSYGYGWFIHDYHEVVVCQTPGLTDGTTSVMMYVPQLELGIVILANLENPFFPRTLAFSIIDCYLNRNEKDWDEYFKSLLLKGLPSA